MIHRNESDTIADWCNNVLSAGTCRSCWSSRVPRISWSQGLFHNHDKKQFSQFQSQKEEDDLKKLNGTF